MRNNKKKLIIVSIIVLVVVIFASSAYAFFYTDVFKSNKQRFFKYMSQNSQIYSSMQCDKLKQYNDKKKVKAFENSGNFSAYIAEDIAKKYISNQKIYNELQNFKITFDGKKDLLENYEESNIAMQYSNGEKMSFDYLRQEEYYGFKIENILKKYIVIQNDNLKEFAKKLQISDTSSIPNKIKIREIEKYSLNENELENIKSKLYQILDVNLTDDKFSKSKEQNYLKYTLKLTSKEIETILNTMYEAIINDEAVSKKMNLYFVNELRMDENVAKEEISKIKKYFDNAKDAKNNSTNDDEIESKDENNIDIIEINLYESKGTLIKTEICLDNQKITLKINTNRIEFQFDRLQEDGNSKFFDTYANIIAEKQQTEDELLYKIVAQNRKEKNELEVNVNYKGLQNIERVNEEYSVSYMSNEDNTNPDIKYTVNNNVIFKDDIEKINIKENGVKINNYDTEKLQSTIGRIVDKVEEINKKQMESLGLTENENPIFYTIPSSNALNAIYGNLTNQQNKMLNNSKIAQLSKKRESTKDKITSKISELTASYYEERIQNTTIASQSLDEYIKSMLMTETEITDINNQIRVHGYKAKYDENKGIVCTSEEDSIVLVCKIANGRTSWSEENDSNNE